MNNKYPLGFVALAMVAILGIGTISAFGVGKGFMGAELGEEERAEIQEQRVVMQNAIETGNYAEWEALMQERIAKMEDFVNEENFAKIQERYEQMSKFKEALDELKESEDFSREAMQELKEEYGVEGKGSEKMNQPRMRPFTN